MSDKTRFTIISDKQFRDNLITIGLDGKQTQVEYLVLNERQRIATDDARKLAEADTTDGGGWKLVLPHDAMPLIQYGDKETAVHPELLEMLKFDGYWMVTGQDDPSDSACACYVGLGSGLVGWLHRYYLGLAVACRRVSPRQ